MRDPSGGQDLRSHDFPKPFYINVWSKIIMSFLGRLPATGLQSLTFSRRELPGKLLAIGMAALLPQAQIKSCYPLPEFSIGDLVASDWEDDEDPEAPDSATDFGEILGMRWVLERESGLAPNTWVYFVRWTHSTCGAYSCYPCYDGEPTRECDLRLVKQS